MILDIKKLVSERKRITVGELSLHFDSSPEVIDAIMQELEKRGLVRICSRKSGNCGGCDKCGSSEDSVSNKVYEHIAP